VLFKDSLTAIMSFILSPDKIMSSM